MPPSKPATTGKSGHHHCARDQERGKWRFHVNRGSSYTAVGLGKEPEVNVVVGPDIYGLCRRTAVHYDEKNVQGHAQRHQRQAHDRVSEIGDDRVDHNPQSR